MSQKKASLSRKEIAQLMEKNPEPGDILVIHRNHPHVSCFTPYVHTDLVYFRYLGDEKFEVIRKDHIPCSPDLFPSSVFNQLAYPIIV